MRPIVLATCAAAAVAAAGVAVAGSIGTSAIKPVTATFAATTVLGSKVRTCTTPAGTLTVTALDLSGSTASSDPALNGSARIRLTAVVDTAKQAGVVEGVLRIDTHGARDTIARLDGVYANGRVHGLLRGSAERPFQRLAANVSADFSASTGLTNGRIGDTVAGGGAVLVQPGRCPAEAAREKVEATGTVSAVSDTSITVAGVSCSVPASLVEEVRKVKVADRVRISCRSENGQLVLTEIVGRKK